MVKKKAYYPTMGASLCAFYSITTNVYSSTQNRANGQTRSTTAAAISNSNRS